MSARERIERLRRASRRDLLLVGIPVALLVAAVLLVAVRHIQPAPPRTLTIATGAPGGAYERYGTAYQAIFARYGIRLKVRNTAGSLENAQLLRDGQVDAAFIQGGTAEPHEDDGLFSLGGLYYEPLWVFYRATLAPGTLDEIAQLKGRRIAIDGPGSGTHALALEILRANGMDRDRTERVELGGLPAVTALTEGRVDAVFVVGATQSAAVWTLLYTPGVKLMSLSQAEAYARMLPHLTRVKLPRGAVDLVTGIPAQDVTLVAPTATLAVGAETHPAHVDLLLQAIAEVHGTPGLFHHLGDFPRAQGVDFPLAPAAERYYKSGKPLLQRYLPFWIATWLDRMVVLLIPLAAVLYPAFKFAPAAYGWRVRSRIYRRYGELKFLEAEIGRETDAHRVDEWLERLDAIEQDANRITTPLTYTDMFYTLRSHIDLVRASIVKRAAGETNKN